MKTPIIPVSLNSLLLIDIETVGITPSLTELEKVNKPLYDSFVGYRDWFDKRYPEEKESSNEDLFLNKAALTSEFLKVVSVSIGWFDEGVVKTKNYTMSDEKELLTEVCTQLNKAYAKGWWLCGHNIKGFDLPTLSKRFVINDILPSEFCARLSTKPWDLRVVDTKELWQFTNSFSLSSLDLICSSLGIKSSKGGEVQGNNLHVNYYSSNPPKESTLKSIGDYCDKDVVALGEIVKYFYNLK